MPSPSRPLLLALVFAIATATILLGAGCGGGSKGTVTGKVVYNGQALTNGSVQFMTTAGAFASEISADGSYAISDAPTGLAKIAVSCQDPRYEEYMKQLTAAARDKSIPKPRGTPQDFSKIPPRYNDFNSSGLTYEVKAGQQTYDIELR